MEIPPRYREFIEPFISVARKHIENGQALVPFAFVASFEKNAGVPIQIDARDDEAKEKSVEAIAEVVAEIGADCVFSIVEGWDLPRHMAPRYREIVEFYGSVTNCPFKVLAVHFVLETRHGVWIGQGLIEAGGSDGKTRTFGEVTLEYAPDCEGRYARQLRAKRTNPPGCPTLQ